MDGDNVPKIDGLWDIGQVTFDDAGDTEHRLLIAADEFLVLGIKAISPSYRESPYIFLTVQDCNRLEQFLKKCRQNAVERERRRREKEHYGPV